MGNVYGIAQPLALPAAYVAGSDVAVPASTETTCITTGALIAPGPGDFYPIIWMWTYMVLGATPPTTMTFAFKLGAGSDVDSFAVDTNSLVANGNVRYFIPLVGVNSGSAWVGAGSTINITCNAAGQAVTFKAGGSRAVVALFRGPDA